MRGWRGRRRKGGGVEGEEGEEDDDLPQPSSVLRHEVTIRCEKNQSGKWKKNITIYAFPP